MRPARSRIQGFSSRGSAPSSSSTSSIQRPAIAVQVGVGDHRDRADPTRVDPLDRPVVGVAGSLELEAGVDEVGRPVCAGHGPGGLGEQVEPGRVESTAEREMGREAAAVVERGQLVGADHQQDVGRLAGDQVHQPAHVVSPAPLTESM